MLLFAPLTVTILLPLIQVTGMTLVSPTTVHISTAQVTTTMTKMKTKTTTK